MPKPLMTIGLVLTLALPGLVWGQNVSVDEGAFRIRMGNQVVGREEFSIRRVGRGQEARLILRGSVGMDLPEGRLRLAPAMEATGEDMTVTAYQLKMSGTRESEIYVTRSGRRYMAKVLSTEGEEVREFRAGPGSVLMDPNIAHQHHLLLPFLNGPEQISLTILSPENGEQTRMTLSEMGEEEVHVGTELIQGRHFRLDGEAPSRDIWFDEQGRVLRVAIPSTGYLAERESLS